MSLNYRKNLFLTEYIVENVTNDCVGKLEDLLKASHEVTLLNVLFHLLTTCDHLRYKYVLSFVINTNR